MRRLVELDIHTFHSKEVDKIRLKREAKALKGFILRISPGLDAFNYRRRVLPLVQTILDDMRALPVPVEEMPLGYEMREALLPDDFEELFARFFNTAIGARADVEHPVERDGKLFAYMDFEELSVDEEAR